MGKYLDLRRPHNENKKKSKILDTTLPDRKAEVMPNFNFIHQNNASSRKSKKIMVALVSFLLILFSSGGVYWWQKNKAEEYKKSKLIINENKDVGENIWDLQKTESQIIENNKFFAEKILLAKKENNHMTIFSKSPKSDVEDILFEFDIDEKIISTSANSASSVEVALSPDKKTIAFVANDGLNIYVLENKEKNSLIRKESESKNNLRIAPQWSAEELTGAYALTNLKWSPDSQFLSFVGVYADYYSLGVINIKSKEYLAVQQAKGGSISGLNSQWSLSENKIFNPEFNGVNQSGLFVSSVEKFNMLDNISEKIEKGRADFYEVAASVDNNKLAFIYKDSYGEEDDNILAVSNTDGNEFSILDKKDFKMLPFFSPSGNAVFFLSNLTDDNLLLSSFDLDLKKKNNLLIFPKNFNFWFSPNWHEGKYLSIFGKSFDPLNKKQKIKEIFLLIDVENKRIINKLEFGDNTEIIGFL